MQKIEFLNFQTLETIENFVCRAIKRYKEVWDVEDRARSGHL